MTDPDITIHFHGLMVFENCTTGTHEQLVRLHSDAAYHKVRILITGPGYSQSYEWGRDHTKGEVLKFEVWKDDEPIPPSVDWQLPTPYDIKNLHARSASLGEFMRIEDAFGPAFTTNAGYFSGVRPPINVDFVSIVRTRSNIPVPAEVEAKVTLSDGQVAVLTADHLQPGVELGPFRLQKPGDTERKWEIHVTNEPDTDHICGYHFLEYYKGFKYSNRPDVPVAIRYAAKPTVMGSGPCDSRPTAAEMKKLQGMAAIETRPCIPISY
jgi:hypothetical protein